MLAPSITPLPVPESRVIRLVSQGLAILTLGLAAGLLVVFAWLAVTWFQQPYPGFTLALDGTVTNPYSFVVQSSPTALAGPQPGDRVLAVNDSLLQPGDAQDGIQRALTGMAHGDRVRLQFERAAGREVPAGMSCVEQNATRQRCDVVVSLARYPVVDFVLQFGLPWLVGLLGLVTASLFLRGQPAAEPVHRVVILAGLLVMLAAGLFDLTTRRALSPWLFPLMLVALGGVLLWQGVEFPSRLALARRRSALRLAPLLAVLTALLVMASRPGGLGAPAQALLVAVTFAVGAWLALLATLMWRIRRAVSPMVRDQCMVVTLGMLLAFAPLLAWAASAGVGARVLGQDLGFHGGLVTPFFFALPLSMAYALAQGVLPRRDPLVSQGIVYGLMALGITLGYGLLVAGVFLFTGSLVQLNNPLLVAGAVFLVALLFMPVRSALERRVTRVAVRDHQAAQSRVEQLAQDLVQVTGLPDVVKAIRAVLEDTLAPTHTFFLFPDNATAQYRAFGIPRPETDIRFDQEGGLVRYLRHHQRALILGQDDALPPALATERSRLAVLGATVLLPLHGRERLSGILAVGPRQNGRRYGTEDLTFMQAVADQAALAVERAQVIANLEQHVREMNVLGQVAQAVNYTVEFDDLLELIYAQTNRVVDAPNFYIALRDMDADELYYAFYSQHDERVVEREGVRWRLGRDLLSEIVRTGQPLRVENYGQELARRGIHSPLENDNLKAWMGVPLSAPESALGVLCVGSTSLGATYHDEQLKILWQIADQAAVAIDKARLFRETEIHARQLTTLNEISTQLATVFQDSERLLRLITESAVEILEAEAGSLLMIDLATQDLEFKVATGRQGQLLMGKRLPAGTGLVGTVADRGEPVIVNDTTRDPRWYSGMDEDAGEFSTVSLIAAPLNGNTGVIGVLEVINKRDGGVFVDDDKRLLVAFAGQAAIAIENARLFQMTDQQLAARVEELDTMQKIDRELNETLRLQRVLNITLDWALRESGADAGAMGMISTDPPGLRIMAHYGYPPETFGEGARWPLDQGVVGRVMRTGQPELVADVTLDKGFVETLPGARCQLTVPLFTGGEVSGMIILESLDANAFTLLDLDFISRLAEHASPAMANAILLAELERANDSRSEFVGFVAHELKTPMTSIKGFSELLIAGAVGPLNDQQKGFLVTIRGNVERMNTLVSDLNDVTKLQTDRMQMEKTPIDFHTVVQETLHPLQAQIEDKRQTVRVAMKDSLPPIYADQNRMVQVLTNLVTNAHKYTPEGGEVTIHAESAPNRWDPGGAAEVLHIWVQDNGIGISTEDQEQLFQAYYRTTNPEALEQPGTGLGLVIVQGIVQQHGGRIWLESRLGEGSAFHLTIPLASAVPETQGASVR